MAKVFSWKIMNGKYAYLLKDESSQSYIRNKITNTEVLRDMSNVVAGWPENVYAREYNELKREVNLTFGVDGHDIMTQDYTVFYNVTAPEGGKLILLSGRDGVDGRNGSGARDILSENDYEILERAINSEFQQYRTALEAKIDAAKSSVEGYADRQVSEAVSRLNLTAEELDDMKDRLDRAEEAAISAIEAANKLFGVSADGITPEKLAEVLNEAGAFNEWSSTYGDFVTDLHAEFDDLSRQVGETGIAQDGVRGLLTAMCTNINTISGTVGSVKTTMDASEGRLEQFASWYDASADTVTEVTSLVDASKGAIIDLAEFYNGEEATEIERRISAQTASITDSIRHESEDSIADVRTQIEAVSGSITEQITRFDVLSGSVTTISTNMNALEGQIETALTKANSALTEAYSMRETWNQESGMLRTVTDLVIRKDENDDAIFYYIDPTLEDPSDRTGWVRVYMVGNNEHGLPVYNTSKDGTGTQYTDNVYPDYLSGLLSYIKQDSGEIELSVLSGNVVSALRLQVTPDGSVIYLTSDRVVIDADIIAKSLTANAADIGGVHVGAGMISAQTGDHRWALTSGGTLEAEGANISGTIHANDGSFKGSISADSGYFSGKIIGSEIEGSDIRSGVFVGGSIAISDDDYVDLYFEFDENNILQAYLSKPLNETLKLLLSFETKDGGGMAEGGYYGYDVNEIAIKIYGGDTHCEPILFDSESGHTSSDIDNRDIWDEADTISKTEIENSYEYIKINGYTFWPQSYNYRIAINGYKSKISPEVIFYNNFIILNRNSRGFYVESDGSFYASNGSFGGYVRNLFTYCSQLEQVNGEYLLDERAYVLAQGLRTPPMLVLPSRNDPKTPIGFTYDILVPPRTTRDDADGVNIRANDDSYIHCYATPVFEKGKAYHLIGGRYQITLLPSGLWSIILATGIMEIHKDSVSVPYDVRVSPLVSMCEYDRGVPVSIIMPYANNSTKPAKYFEDDETMFIRSGSTASVSFE